MHVQASLPSSQLGMQQQQQQQPALAGSIWHQHSDATTQTLSCEQLESAGTSVLPLQRTTFNYMQPGRHMHRPECICLCKEASRANVCADSHLEAPRNHARCQLSCLMYAMHLIFLWS